MLVGVELDVAARILQPLVENACHFARSNVRLTTSRSGGDVLLLVIDDGPGVTEEERERIFEPGVRGSAAVGDDSGRRRCGSGPGARPPACPRLPLET